MSNPMTCGELARKLTAYIPNLDAAEARRRINVAYVNEAMGHCWSHLIKRWTLQTEASYSTGTLAVTNGLTAVTLTGGTWAASWSTAPSSRRIAIQGRLEPYDITITGAAAGTLADPWIGDTLTAATYSMWRDTYPLPADCGYSKLMALYDPLERFRLANKNQPAFFRDRSYNPQLVNMPVELAVMNQTTETPPRPQFAMYPAPASVRAYHGYYFRRPSFMATDAEYPDWPHEFQDMLPLSAAIEHYSTPRFHSEKYQRQLKPTYADLYAKMVKTMDGDSAIDLMIDDISTGRSRWPGGNGNWSPNVLGFVGQGMVNS